MTRQFCLLTPQGNPAPNQQVIHTPSGLYLQSYGQLVAFRSHDGITKIATTDRFQWSKTTTRYVIQFLGAELRDCWVAGKLEIELKLF